MNKMAQRRGFFSKLREKANISGKILENLNEEFKTVMDKMRFTDEKIRDVADTLKSDLKEAKTFLNRRDYLNSALKLAEFHDKCRTVAAYLEHFKKSVDVKHYEFLLGQLDEGQKETLFGYDPSKKIDVNSLDDMLTTASIKKDAGLSDIWYNIFSDKGQAMRALEKRFSVSFLKDLKINTIDMNAKSAQFLTFVLSSLSKLETGISTRNVDFYVRELDIFLKKFASYNTQFIRYYTKSVSPLKQKYEEIKAAERTAVSIKQMEKEKEEDRIAADLKERAEKASMTSAPASILTQERASSPSITNFPEPKTLDYAKQVKDVSEENEPIDLIKKQQFISQLEKLSSPIKMAQEILKYSASLEDIDSEKSLQLLSIAEGILEDYKTAGIFGTEMPGDTGEEIQAPDPLV